MRDRDVILKKNDQSLVRVHTDISLSPLTNICPSLKEILETIQAQKNGSAYPHFKIDYDEKGYATKVVCENGPQASS